MKLNFTRYILLYLAFLTVTNIYASESPRYLYNQILRVDGLKNNKITDIVKDADGTYWIGTQSGLNRIVEGGVIRNPDNNAFGKRQIDYIFRDSLDQIWAAVDNSKVYVYEDRKGEFTRVKFSEGEFFARSYLLISGGVLFNSSNDLYKYEYSDREIKKIHFEAPHHFKIRSTALIDNERVAIMDFQNNIYVLNLKTLKLTHLDGISLADFRVIRNLFVDSNQKIWIPVYGSGLLCYSIDDGGTLVKHINAENSGDNINIVLDIVEHKGKLWVSTDGGGIKLIDVDSHTIEQFSDSLNPHIAGQIKSSMMVYITDNDDIWIGTVRNGVINIRETHIQGFNLRKLYQWRDGLNSATIINIAEGDKNDIWLGVDDDGLAHYNPTSNKLRHIKSTAGMKVTNMVDISRDYILISVYNKGLYRVNKQTEEITPVVIINKEVSNTIKKYDISIKFVKIDSNRVFVIANKVYVYDVASNKVEYSQNKSLNSFSGFVVSQHDKNEAIIHNFYEVYTLNKQTSEHKLIYSNAKQPITSVRKKDNTLWIIQGDSLSTFDINNKVYTPIENSYNGEIQSLEMDSRGNMWISTYNKLVCIDSSDGELKYFVFDYADGYMPNEYLSRATMVTKAGDVYMGGYDGFLFIDSQTPIVHKKCKSVKLLSIELDNKIILPNDENPKRIFTELPWDYASLDVKVCVKDDNVFRKNEFRYTIKSTNRHSIVTSDNTLSLPTLSSGQYSVYVSYLMSNSKWSDDVHLIDINVSTPWWQSNAMYVFIIILALALFIWLVNRYIHRKKQAILRIQEHKEQELMHEKIKFLVNISHELRTPLTLIYAPLKRLIDSADITTKLRKELSLIFVQSRHMSKLINMVLNLRKLEAGYDELNIEPHQLNSWVESIVEEFKTEMTINGIELTCDFDSNISLLNFDEDKCKSVLANLLMNAYKYSESNTKVTVETRKYDDYIRISVVDQGVGLANIDVDTLFDRFVQQHDKSAGTGIGLAYSKMLVEMHNGRISAYANQDRGSTFYFEIPVDLICHKSTCESKEYLNVALGSMDESISNRLDYSLREHTILIVEDKRELRNYMRDAIKSFFKKVYTASDGIEALEMTNKFSPDIILSDVMMPRMDGYELCASVKNNINISHIPVVLVTSKADSANRIMGYKLGADGFIPKPFDIDEVVDIVRNQLYSRSMIKRRYAETNIITNEISLTFSNADEQFMLKLNSFIKENIANSDFNIQMMTDHMCMSRAVFYKKLNAIINIGAMEYVTKQRMILAADMLIETKEKISTIATHVGYSDNQYFSKTFKQYHGSTPSTYRKNNEMINTD